MRCDNRCVTTRLPALLALALTLALPALAEGASKSRARAFASCEAVGDYARKHALKIVGPGGLPVRFGFAIEGRCPPRARRPVPAMTPQEGAVRDGDGVDYSTTNVQEEGVDEPDIVKTDGAPPVRDQREHALRVRRQDRRAEAGGLARAERLRAPAAPVRRPRAGPHHLLGRPGAPAAARAGLRALARIPIPSPATRLFEIDVSDKTAPKLLNTLTVEGSYVSARLRGSVARVVIATPPSPWPVEYESGQSTEEAEAEQRRAIRRTRLSTWMPDGVLRDRVRDKRRVRRVVACDDVRKPVAYSGPGMLSVLTLDLAQGLKPLDSDSLMTDAQTIYASKRSLFVAAERWFDPTVSDPDQTVDAGRFTAIHRFAIDDPQSAEYRASGQVRGFVLNQFSLSEHDGVLRVATTDQPPWRANAEQRESESFVTVLDEQDKQLQEVGRVGGLGRGERIFAVRFLGEKGYVVTFRQVDPLYTLDLSNPQKPAVRGELKILGFSSYLHPIGDDLLLGLGQDANEQGQTQGTQLSLFDVSDLSDPRRLHQRSLGESTSSAAEYDHHAFLYWPPTKLTVVPLSAYRPEDSFNGAVGFRVERDKGISPLGSAEHDGGTIMRSLVANGHLLTVSDRGVLASTLDTLAPVSFARLPTGSDPLEKLVHALDRPREHRAVAALHHRTLEQWRVLRHQRDDLVVGEVAALDVLLVGGLALAQQVRRRAAGLAHELADLVLRQRIDVVVHALEVDPALLQQRDEVAAGRAGGLLVDGDVAHGAGMQARLILDSFGDVGAHLVHAAGGCARADSRTGRFIRAAQALHRRRDLGRARDRGRIALERRRRRIRRRAGRVPFGRGDHLRRLRLHGDADRLHPRSERRALRLGHRRRRGQPGRLAHPADRRSDRQQQARTGRARARVAGHRQPLVPGPHAAERPLDPDALARLGARADEGGRRGRALDLESGRARDDRRLGGSSKRAATLPDTLQKAQVPITTDAYCAQQYGSSFDAGHDALCGLPRGRR